MYMYSPRYCILFPYWEISRDRCQTLLSSSCEEHTLVRFKLTPNARHWLTLVILSYVILLFKCSESLDVVYFDSLATHFMYLTLPVLVRNIYMYDPFPRDNQIIRCIV